MAAVFLSLPVTARVLFGAWDFQDAAALACLCFMAGVYFHISSRRFAVLPDPASILERAAELAATGRVARAIALLSDCISLSPRLWQPYQYRGELYLQRSRLKAALADFSQAILLAPAESHLYVLRGHVQGLLGDPEAERADLEHAAALGAFPPAPSVPPQ